MWFIKYIIFVGCIISVVTNKVPQDALEESEIDIVLLENIVLYGITSELANRNTNISSMCAFDLTNILRGINKKDMWAVKGLFTAPEAMPIIDKAPPLRLIMRYTTSIISILYLFVVCWVFITTISLTNFSIKYLTHNHKIMDASGTYQSSFVWGNNAWLGSKLQCDFLNTPPEFTITPDLPKLMHKDLISTITPMEMKYKMIFLIITSPYKIDPIIHLRTANTHRLGLCLPKSCSNDEIELLSKSFFSHQKLAFQKLYNATMEVINVRDMDVKNFLNRPEVSGILFTIGFVTTLVIVFNFANTYMGHTNKDGLKRFLECFSIYDNVVRLYDTSSSPNAINSVNGIRSVLCFWVLLFHCGYFTTYAFDNLPVFMAGLERIELQPFLVLVFFVDVFFVLSALLLVFNFLKDERNLFEIRNSSYLDQVKLFVKKIIHRYIRLTPACLLVIGISHILSIYIQESSSLYIDEHFEAYCTKKGLWSSVFYIQNFFRMEDLCISWSWYLACDMQFYIIILFILFTYARSPALAKGLFMALFALISAIGIHSNIKINLLPRMDSLNYHTSEFYFGPIQRMHPSLAGATVGYIMFKMKDKNFKKNTFATILYWIGATSTFFALLFVTALKDSSNLNFALFLSFGRYIMSLFVGSVIFMCHFGYGGIFNKLISSRFFVHVSKTTFMIYLVHPVLILYFNSNQESSPHFDVASQTTTVLGILVMSYFAAIVISHIFEIPFQRLSDEYIQKRSKTKK